MKHSDTGIIFNIQRFSIHDGQGIRTLIFLKGCPLCCRWCANPESQRFGPEILFFREKCIGCGRCLAACPNEATDPDGFGLDRERCISCGACVTACPAEAKKSSGRQYTVSELISVIEQDRIFYRNSSGGVTVGGGEPLAQPAFAAELMRACKKRQLHTAIETCGYAPWKEAEAVFRCTDQVFYDLKHMDAQVHRRITGVSNERILENAQRLAGLDKEIIFRIPVIPGYNDDISNIRATGRFVQDLSRRRADIRLELLAYHGLGENKYRGLDRAYELTGAKADKSLLDEYREELSAMGLNVL